MSEYVPKLQEQLRKQGFPRFDEEQIRQFVFGPGRPESREAVRWNFRSKDEYEDVILTSDFVVYETSRYNRFADFVERLSLVIELLKEVAEIDLVSQIGLRYVDLVQRLDSHEPHWFLQERIKGLAGSSIGIDEARNQLVVTAKTPEGQLTVRCLEGRGPNFMPPDLDSTHLKFDTTLEEGTGFRILDFDHVWRGETDFDTASITEQTGKLKQYIWNAFKATVTEDAIEVWKRGEPA